ncbi:MAG: hypothetical protein LBH58_00450 [Tannerellaceae bacterium]|nr:hypothetical protein [Tannerellaceae bacterium]
MKVVKKRIGLRKRISLFFVLSVLCLCSKVMAQGVVQLKIDSVPAIGKGGTVFGRIELTDGVGRYGDYKITMSLQVERGGRIWGPKPYAAYPSVPVNDSGKFVCRFVTGGNDSQAETLYVFLIPKGFTPNEDEYRTEAAAIDKVMINRYKDGRIEIQYRKPAAEPDNNKNDKIKHRL